MTDAPDEVVGTRSPGWPARVLMALVVAYRRSLGPLLGPRCRFEPSCSAYALDALRLRGALRGTTLTVWRLLRCQPFGTPGYDPVPIAAPRPVPGSVDVSCFRPASRTVQGAHPSC